MTRIYSRRTLLSSTVKGASALALGGLFMEGLAHGGPGVSKSKPGAAKNTIKGPPGAASVPGDLVLASDARALAELVLFKSRHAFAAAAANPGKSFTANKLSRASARFVDKLSSARVTRVKTRASGLLSASASKKVAQFGAYGSMSTGVYETTPKPDIAIQNAVKTLKWKKPRPSVSTGPHYRKIEFHLNTVKCVVETDENSASDEILLGGQLVDPSGNVASLSSFKVGNDFDQGEVVHYDYALCKDMSTSEAQILLGAGACHGGPSDVYKGKKLASSALDGPWPGTWALVLLMVEEDMGGFGDLLGELYAAVKQEVEAAIEAAGVAVGSAIGGAIGALIGEVIAWVLSELVAWLVGLFDNPDDPIAAKSWVITLPSHRQSMIQALSNDPLPTPGNIWASPMKKLEFHGDGGEYHARLHWRAIA